MSDSIDSSQRLHFCDTCGIVFENLTGRLRLYDAEQRKG